VSTYFDTILQAPPTGLLPPRELSVALRRNPEHVSGREVAALVADALADPVHTLLFGTSPETARELVKKRLELFHRVQGVSRDIMGPLWLRRLPVRTLWSYMLPLAQFLTPALEVGRGNPSAREGCWFIGIAGGPGAGKTTLARFLKLIIEQTEQARREGWRVLSVSMDDFYYTKSERQQLGYPWRAMPGTHDMRLLLDAFTGLKARAQEVRVPRFDHSVDERKGIEVVQGPVDVCIVDGLMADHHCPGHEVVNRLVDYLVWLDMDPKYLKRNRLMREARVRRYAQVGFSRERILQFWQEVIEPLLADYYPPIKERADLVLSLSPRQTPVGGVLRRRPLVPGVDGVHLQS
jgi:uridine kinase